MGGYCRFCGERCFIPLPPTAPKAALFAYGRATIVATCPAGQAFERERVGWSYDLIQEVNANASV